MSEVTMTVSPDSEKVMKLQENRLCFQSGALVTSFESDTQAYGAMFNVKAKEENILVETLELSSVIAAGHRDIHVMVFSKVGSYVNYENDPASWTKVADAHVTPAAAEGVGTVIPTQEFHPVQIQPGQECAFYITLDTTDLRYSSSLGKAAGSVYSEDDYLQIQVGAGLLNYPFADKIFEPRLFCGIVHYKRMTDCSSMEYISTEFRYAFLVQHDNRGESYVLGQVNKIVKGSVAGLLDSDPALQIYKTSAGLQLVETESKSMASYSPEAYAACVTNTVRVCTLVVTRVKLSHAENLKRGDLIYRMLVYRRQITANVDSTKQMDAAYIGAIPVETHVIVRLEGVPDGELMEAHRRTYFEHVTHEFLVAHLSQYPTVSIYGVHVSKLDTVGRRRLSSWPRQLQSSGLSTVDVDTVVTASVKPPPYMDLGILVEDAIDYHAQEFRENLITHRDMTLTSKESKFFAEIHQVAARPVNGTDRNPVVLDEGGMAGWAISLVVFFVLGALGGLSFVSYRKWQYNRFIKEDYPLREQDVDSDISRQSYEEAFRGFVDEDVSDHDRPLKPLRRQVVAGQPTPAAKISAPMTPVVPSSPATSQPSNDQKSIPLHASQQHTSAHPSPSPRQPDITPHVSPPARRVPIRGPDSSEVSVSSPYRTTQKNPPKSILKTPKFSPAHKQQQPSAERGIAVGLGYTMTPSPPTSQGRPTPQSMPKGAPNLPLRSPASARAARSRPSPHPTGQVFRHGASPPSDRNRKTPQGDNTNASSGRVLSLSPAKAPVVTPQVRIPVQFPTVGAEAESDTKLSAARVSGASSSSESHQKADATESSQVPRKRKLRLELEHQIFRSEPTERTIAEMGAVVVGSGSTETKEEKALPKSQTGSEGPTSDSSEPRGTEEAGKTETVIAQLKDIMLSSQPNISEPGTMADTPEAVGLTKGGVPHLEPGGPQAHGQVDDSGEAIELKHPFEPHPISGEHAVEAQQSMVGDHTVVETILLEESAVESMGAQLTSPEPYPDVDEEEDRGNPEASATRQPPPTVEEKETSQSLTATSIT